MPSGQGEMYNKVKVDDSFWTLEDGKEVSIALQKVHMGFLTRTVFDPLSKISG